MGQFFKGSVGFFALPIFILIMVSSCDKDMSVMLDSGATSDVGITFIDSFTVNTSTVQLDNLPTQATGNMLFGKASITETGSVTSTPFFRIGFSEFNQSIPENASFDSLNLVLRPNASRYYFGDTTVLQKIAVHQVTENIETTTLTRGVEQESIPVFVTGASIFSKQKFNYDPTALGSRSFLPRITSMDSIDIKLDNSLGQTLFDFIQSKDMKVASNTNFQEYFKGLALVPDDNNTVAIGFSDTIQLKINYSYVGIDGLKKTNAKVLNIPQREFQYNHIVYDRTGTAFASLDLNNKEISTTATAGLTYAQGGAGVVAKLTFPSLKEFVRDENISINKAELVIETASPATNTMYPILGNLMLFVADYNGVPTSYLTTPYGAGMQQANYTPGEDVGKNGTYTFNMIVYLRNLKTTNQYNETSLYLSAGSVGLFNTLNTVLIATENAKPKIKLNILYTKFK